MNALIAPGEPRAAALSARHAVRAGFRTLKLKVAHGALEDDLARVGAVRAAIGDDVRLRLDANGGWTRELAMRALDALAAFAPELVEQPVSADALDALAFVRARSPIPIAADESLVDAQRGERVLELGAADSLVLKPAALGGLRASLRSPNTRALRVSAYSSPADSTARSRAQRRSHSPQHCPSRCPHAVSRRARFSPRIWRADRDPCGGHSMFREVRGSASAS